MLNTNPCDIDGVAGTAVGDLLLLKRHVTGEIVLDAMQVAACDGNADGLLDVYDWLRLQRFLLTVGN